MYIKFYLDSSHFAFFQTLLRDTPPTARENVSKPIRKPKASFDNKVPAIKGHLSRANQRVQTMTKHTERMDWLKGQKQFARHFILIVVKMDSRALSLAR